MILGEVPIAGVFIRLLSVNDWPTFYDAEAGWVCIGNPVVSKENQAINFATDIIAILDKDILQSICSIPTSSHP